MLLLEQRSFLKRFIMSCYTFINLTPYEMDESKEVYEKAKEFISENYRFTKLTDEESKEFSLLYLDKMKKTYSEYFKIKEKIDYFVLDFEAEFLSKIITTIKNNKRLLPIYNEYNEMNFIHVLQSDYIKHFMINSNFHILYYLKSELRNIDYSIYYYILQLPIKNNYYQGSSRYKMEIIRLENIKKSYEGIVYSLMEFKNSIDNFEIILNNINGNIEFIDSIIKEYKDEIAAHYYNEC